MLGLNRLESFPEALGSTPNGTPEQRKKSVVDKKRKEKKKKRNISLQAKHRNLHHLEMEKGYHPQLEETEVGVGKLQRKHPQRRSERNEEGKPEEQIKKPYFIRKNVQIELNSPSSSRAATDHSERHVLHSTAQEAHERKWFPVDLTDDSQCEAPTCFYGPKSGENPISLVLMQGCSEGTNELMDEPWLLVAKSVMKDLLLSFQHVKCEMKGSNMEELKPTLVACFGKILFHGISANSQESLKRNLAVEKLGLEYVEEKELYYVKLSDNLCSDSTAGCKCTVIKDQGKVQLHKDEEINGINNLIGSAILDSEVKGGLRWPFGEDSLGSQYAVIDVWHTTAKSYGNLSIRFKLRHPDRFDFRSSTGEVAQEASLKMPGIVSQLRAGRPSFPNEQLCIFLLEQTIDEKLVLKMLEDNLRLIWDHCLSDGSSS
ncbi:hypothetical protein H5410_022540 [Solanum commersonii]|uniref:DUF7903 domain-containing protein n=1 Tax=Solanum commersonii TaxID=4109 RepID=A0A9J5ZEA8_SOLCO|nr:hypothetical protein H5410_022540 [Solanum commersonii]